ncbi:hypothetical protein [Mesorhizobium silamurunense]|uniref:hypothetical protein n=1 Tax=Mesorhizobium silamurunense TaxID=499528 RepID=UPI001FEE9C69|nr:hypothetical protein [Mesorhizobium silamurunense]
MFADPIRASSFKRLHETGRTEDCTRPMRQNNELPLASREPSTEDVAGPHTSPKRKKPKARKPARTLPPAWLTPGNREKSEAQLYKLPAPPPPVAPGRQPHVAAMRFLDCLFGRCRAPIDLALREDAEDDPLGARPGPDMLCCGLRTPGTRSYCAHHHARFHGHRGM